MNENINNYNEKEVKNKLKNFKEGKDYSVLHEGKKEIFNFHNNFLRDVFGNDYTTIYEVAESWDSDNFNHARAAAEYKNDKSHITYRYEHRINKGGDYYKEWSWGDKDFGKDGYKHSWALRDWYNPDFDNAFFLPGNFENDEIIKHQERLNESRLRSIERDKKEFEDKLAYYESLPAEERRNKDIISLKDKINFLRKEIEEEKDWINRNNPQQRGRIGRNEVGKWITDENDEHPAECCACGFKEIRPSDSYCMKCGTELCEKTKSAKSDKSDLEKENRELKKQLSEVKNQLKEVLEELKKLRSNSSGQNKAELDQQIDYNEKLIRHGEEVPAAEIKEQVKNSQALLEKANFSVAPTKNNPGSGSLPYIIGGVVLVSVAAIVGYYLWSRKRKNKVS